MFSHRSQQPAFYITITTQSNKRLSLTQGHYMWVMRAQEKHPAIIRAGDIQVGDNAWVVQSDRNGSAMLVAEKILQIGTVEKSGMYNPHTPSGCIVVDDVAALTFTETLPASLVWHTVVTIPARALYSLLPLEVASCVNQNMLSAYFALPSFSSYLFFVDVTKSMSIMAQQTQSC